jgi:hypothetical protein
MNMFSEKRCVTEMNILGENHFGDYAHYKARTDWNE